MIGIVFGICLIGFSVLNTGMGLVASRVIVGAEGTKLDVMRMLQPQLCRISDIEAELAAGNTSMCLGAVGQWAPVDILFVFLGLFVLLYGRVRFTNTGLRSQKKYNFYFAAGAVLFSIAILDRLNFLPKSANSNGIADLIPFSVHPLLVQAIIAGIGAFLMAGPRYWEAEAVEQTHDRLHSRRDVAAEFRKTFGSVGMRLGARSGSSSRITRSRILNKDSMLHMQRTNTKGIKVLATCPYCRGAGCNKCNQTGTL
ncbi:MAG: hypothetical protein CMA63_01655 [Euryarchaeota archaeon]|nr:hypothetical protein [Euryarchaeota archaeon]